MGKTDFAEALITVLREDRPEDLRTDRQIAQLLGKTAPAVSLLQSRSITKIGMKKWIRAGLNAAYSYGYKEALESIQGDILEIAQDIYKTASVTRIAEVFGVTRPSIYSWNSGTARIQKGKLKKFLENRAKLQIFPIIELAEIHPIKKGKSYKIDRTEATDQKLRSKLEVKKGVYIFYDSGGRAIYVGKTAKGKNDLYREIKQRLKAGSDQTFYVPVGKELKKKKIEYGLITRKISAYQLLDNSSIHNLEVLLLRSFSNDHRNKNLGHFI